MNRPVLTPLRHDRRDTYIALSAAFCALIPIALLAYAITIAI